MLIVAGYFKVGPSDRAAFIENRTEAILRSRGEKGCHAYAFSPDPVDPGLINLYERWETAEDLAAHAAANRANARPSDGIEVLASEVLRYEIAEVGPLAP